MVIKINWDDLEDKVEKSIETKPEIKTEIAPCIKSIPYIIHQADIMEWCGKYTGEKFHALLCDPPYHLTSITKRFGQANSKPPSYGTNGAFSRVSKGFMGKTWDGGEIAFNPNLWEALGNLLYPGAFGMAFASSRGWHRLAIAIEDAGFIIHPSIFGWVFGSGFPKATRIDTQIDKALGLDREVVGSQTKARSTSGNSALPTLEGETIYSTWPLTTPNSDLAKTWENYRYGLQALKPALEPIIVFQKPYEGKAVDCITATGAGALNIGGNRIETTDNLNGGGYSENYNTSTFLAHGGQLEFKQPPRRWPANFVLGHSPDCEEGHCVDDCPVKLLGIQSGESKSSGGRKNNQFRMDSGFSNKKETLMSIENPGLGDIGTASRYFYNVENNIDTSDPIFYCPKASTKERNEGLGDFKDDTIDDGRDKSIDNPYQRGETIRKNTHPTVKPINLNKHLAGLLLPPVEYAPRRILIPFAGVASEMIGACLANWDEVVGIEKEEEYVKIAESRLKYHIKDK